MYPTLTQDDKVQTLYATILADPTNETVQALLDELDEAERAGGVGPDSQASGAGEATGARLALAFDGARRILALAWKR